MTSSNSSRRRFASTSDDEISDKRLKLHAGNTLKANQKCGTIFREYLREKLQDDCFESYDSVRLNEALGHFYMDLRKPGGERYKTTSFESIRHGINRYLRAPPYNREFDIVKDACFSEANTNCRAVMAEMKRMGLAKIDHHPMINEADRHALYSSIHLSPDTPIGLANKVQFDIRLYFFRRVMENMHGMKKTDFQVQVDAKTGQKYVTKITDEMTKNHRETDKENFSGVMPESRGVFGQCNGSTLTIDIPLFQSYLFKYPEIGTYKQNLSCNWAFNAPDDLSQILTRVSNSFVDCGDSLKVYTENKTDLLVSDGCSSPLGGSKPAFITSQNGMMVEFITDDRTVVDGSKTETGFQLPMIAGYDLSYADEACDSQKNLTAFSTSQYITSRNFPSKGEELATCRWVITAEDPNANVSVTIEFIDLDEYNNQCYDTLAIIDNSVEELIVCGALKFFPDYSYTSNNRSVTIELQTNKFGTSHSFLLSFRQIAPIYPTTVTTLEPTTSTPEPTTETESVITSTIPETTVDIESTATSEATTATTTSGTNVGDLANIRVVDNDVMSRSFGPLFLVLMIIATFLLGGILVNTTMIILTRKDD